MIDKCIGFVQFSIAIWLISVILIFTAFLMVNHSLLCLACSPLSMVGLMICTGLMFKGLDNMFL